MQRFFGGTMSRAEGYGLFFAAVVLIGGGISGAIVVTSGSEVAAPEPTVVATTVPPTTETTTTTGPPVTEAPTTTASRPAVDPQLGSLPATTVPAQPVQDFTAFCTMPNIVGTHPFPLTFPGAYGFEPVQRLIDTAAGCGQQLRYDFTFCFDASLVDTVVVTWQDPAPNTLVHKVLGRISYTLREPPRRGAQSIDPSQFCQ